MIQLTQVRPSFLLITKIFGVAALLVGVASAIAEELDHGPRAGFVRGSGPMQSELVLGPGSGFRVYLIDEQWNDVSLTGGSLSASLKQKTPVREVSLVCAVKDSFFRCELPVGVTFLMGDELLLKASLAEGKANEFHYTFPFKMREEAKLPLESSTAAVSSTGAAASAAPAAN